MQELLQSVSYLKGVGPKVQAALGTLGITTVRDLLYFFPKRYNDLIVKTLAEISDQEKVVLKGVVGSPALLKRLGGKRNLVIVRLLVDNETIPVTFFNQPWLKRQFTVGQEVLIYGRFDAAKRSLTGMKVLSDDQATNQLAAIYPTNRQISQKSLIKLIHQAVDQYLPQVPNLVPLALRQTYHLLTDQQIIVGMHFPKSKQQAHLARRSAKFRELFLYSLRLCDLKVTTQKQTAGLAQHYDEQYVQQFVSDFSFQLTAAQTKVLTEILTDLKAPQPMNRLLQGDVGSGKTAVAATAMFASVTAGYQTVLMAPTEILAQQHYQKLAPLFEQFQMTTSLLTSSLKAPQKKLILNNIQQGHTNIIIGTQAVFQTAVQYQRLGLVVIDEQHRFGVRQRKALRQKGGNPDVLLMTATPIPRTLAITYYGEMDLSIIDELPAGRQAVKTYWLRSNKLEQVRHFMTVQLQQQAQIFIVTALVEDSDKMTLTSAKTLYQELQQQFPQARIGLVHGQLTAADKAQTMEQFKQHQLDILIATTVIEVGVDVPDATVMIILNAERFGLSQLHQLRGRVGRGQQAAYCILVGDPANQTAIQRLKIMTQTNDGFKLAQKDLELRGSGDFFGDQQSGLPQFELADPVSDVKMLDIAYQEARKLMQTDPNLTQFPQLKQYLQTVIHDNLD